LRDHPGPGAERLPLSLRARHALGVLGRSVALRATVAGRDASH